ncbi:MAG: PspA-associated protein PspAA [Solirubrobacteraceae bacterium]
MIVRIFSDDQYRVPDDVVDRMNKLDNECVAAVEAGDEPRFRACYQELLALVKTEGEQLADDALTGSDLMLPPADITMDEAREEFTGEGLIPG